MLPRCESKNKGFSHKLGFRIEAFDARRLVRVSIIVARTAAKAWTPTVTQLMRVHQIKPIFYQAAFHPILTQVIMRNCIFNCAPHRLLVWVLVVGCFLLGSAVGPRVASAQESSAQQATDAKHAAPSNPSIEPANAAATSHAPRSGDPKFFSREHRQKIYEESRLSVAGAVGRNLLLPGLGNVYAEQYFYAGIAFSLMVFAASFVSYGLVTDQSEFLWTGAATAGVAYVGSIGTSIIGVRKYNLERREGLKVEAIGSAEATPFGPTWSPSVNVGWRF